jgi:putative permease
MIDFFKNWINRFFSDPQVIILWLLLILGSVMIFMLGEMLAPVFASIIIAYLLEGIIAWLHRNKIPRFVSVFIVFLFFMACLMIIMIVLLPMLSRQIGDLLQELPTMVAKGQKKLMLIPESYPDIITEPQIRRLISYLSSELTNYGQQILTISIASVRGLITLIVYLILVPLLVFFFLKDKEVIISWVRDFLPEQRGLATEVWNEVNQQVTNYIRGKIWEILIVWLVSYATFIFLGLNFAMLIALFVGLSVLVPYIGATLMFIPVSLIAFFQWGLSSQFMYTLIAYSIIQALDGNLLVPLLLSEVVNLHPVAIIVAVLVFGGLWGLWGLFFAIPLATLVHAVLKTWANQTRMEKSG